MAILCWAAKNSLRGTHGYSRKLATFSELQVAIGPQITNKFSKVQIRKICEICGPSANVTLYGLQFADPIFFVIC
jgi:hypothetical protein